MYSSLPSFVPLLAVSLVHFFPCAYFIISFLGSVYDGLDACITTPKRAMAGIGTIGMRGLPSPIDEAR